MSNPHSGSTYPLEIQVHPALPLPNLTVRFLFTVPHWAISVQICSGTGKLYSFIFKNFKYLSTWWYSVKFTQDWKHHHSYPAIITGPVPSVPFLPCGPSHCTQFPSPLHLFGRVALSSQSASFSCPGILVNKNPSCWSWQLTRNGEKRMVSWMVTIFTKKFGWKDMNYVRTRLSLRYLRDI